MGWGLRPRGHSHYPAGPGGQTYGAKADHSQPLNQMEFALLCFGFPWDPQSLSSFWLLPSGVGMSNPPLHFGSAPLVWFQSFTAGEEFRMNQTSSLSNFSAIEMRFGTPSWCWKVLKLSGMLRWVECILHVRGTWILGGPKAECYGNSYVPPNSNPPVPCMSEGDLVCKAILCWYN